MIRIICTIVLCVLAHTTAFASQSMIATATGKACMGDDKSRKETEHLALLDAKRQAIEYTLTHVKSETKVKDFQLEKDLVDAYAHASVRILEEKGAWYREATTGDCFKNTIKAEVVPEESKLENLANAAQPAEDVLPLALTAWTDKKTYRSGEKMHVFIQANRHFYARVVYRNAAGEVLQLLPNPFRRNNFLSSGTAHDLPSGDDRFDIEVIPPFGTEVVTVYGSTSQLGDLDLQEASSVYEVRTKASDIAVKTRGVLLISKPGEAEGSTADFAEARVVVTTSSK
jgi:hypothetical protein